MGKTKPLSGAKDTTKRRNIPVTAQTKLRIIEMHQQGMSQAEICQNMAVPRSTLSDIIKEKESFLSRSVLSKATKYYKLFNDLEMQVKMGSKTSCEKKPSEWYCHLSSSQTSAQSHGKTT